MAKRRTLPSLRRALFVGLIALAIAVQTSAAGSAPHSPAGSSESSWRPRPGSTTSTRLLSYASRLGPARHHVRAVDDLSGQAAAGRVPRPCQVAAAFPKVSRDFKTYTFTLRRGFRFSDQDARPRERVCPRHRPHARACHELAGRRAHARHRRRGRRARRRRPRARGVVARGNTLMVRFTRPAPDFPTRTTLPFFCAVPPNLPIDPEGRRAFPGAGPYPSPSTGRSNVS